MLCCQENLPFDPQFMDMHAPHSHMYVDFLIGVKFAWHAMNEDTSALIALEINTAH